MRSLIFILLILTLLINLFSLANLISASNQINSLSWGGARVDADDLKPSGLKSLWEFDSPPQHQLRDFINTRELEQFIERGKQPILFIAKDGVPVDFNGGICIPQAEGFIRALNQGGYQAERYIISSPDYYRYWYNQPLPPNEVHGLVWVNVAGKTYLIEPAIPMAWEMDKPYAGRRVGLAWQ